MDDPACENRNLLRIKLPVRVTLARKRATMGKVLKLRPGSIIRFDKSCDEVLDLVVGDRAVATGEAVELGDQLGLRIDRMATPGEPFVRADGD